ncbi:MAG TPA: DUF4232 domain-containing protein [Candidatus Saccharimonadales bacterium]|jgi:hypothetical protein|nr:DUF4232 domain-containing protein [Candidatus Saccharimonadales bacterium]
MKVRLQAGGAQGAVIVLLLIAVVAVSAGWWYWARHHGSTPVVSVAACSTGHMQLSMGNTNGTAGTIYQDAILKNMGTSSCTLAGWPTVFLTDAGNTAIGNGAAPTIGFAPSTVTIAPNATAHSAVGFPDPGNFTNGVCTATSAKLELYLPGATNALTTPLSEQSCPGLSVSALQSGD